MFEMGRRNDLTYEKIQLSKEQAVSLDNLVPHDDVRNMNRTNELCMWDKERPISEGLYACYCDGEFLFVILEPSVHSDGLCAMCLTSDPLLFRNENVLWGPKIASLEEYHILCKLRMKLKRSIDDETEYEITPKKKIAAIQFCFDHTIAVGPPFGLITHKTFTKDQALLVEIVGDGDFVNLRFSDKTYALNVHADTFKILSKYGSGW